MPQDAEWDSRVPAKEDICPQCNAAIVRGGVCSKEPITLPDGSRIDRVPHKAEMNCSDCGVVPGSTHHFGCHLEVCPLCKQLGECWPCDCWQPKDYVYRSPSMQQREMEN